jgi:dolichol-phosphate mannosyltransferase
MVKTLPTLGIIVPVLNEAPNIQPFVEELECCLLGESWEVIFVDDDSSDDTQHVVASLAKTRPNIRLLERVGRYGLASACIEGLCSSLAPYLAVMDADLQHDPRILPKMLNGLRDGPYNLAIGSRYIEGGGTGEWSKRRRRYSRVATLASRIVTHQAAITDPMSGFFMIKRELFRESVYHLCGKGFKILLDLLSSAKSEVRPIEIPYTFRTRQAGESKLSVSIILEFAILLLDKTFGRLIPYRFLLFVLVGCSGAILHLSILGTLFLGCRAPFAIAQTVASLVAMVLNFTFNNSFTHRDRRLAGRIFFLGLLGFIAVCSVGAFVNVEIASYFYARSVSWWVSGLLGALIGSVWNYAVSATLVWKRR